MSVSYLAEITTDLVQTHIQNNIAAALTSVRDDRADNNVSTEPPQSYFYFPNAQGYRLPAVFTIVDSIDFQKREKGGNYVTAKVKMNISVLVEDRDMYRLTKKAWRYQAALYNILDETQLTDDPNKVKIIIIVENATYSSIYSVAQETGNAQGVFRKEVVLECEIQQIENF